MYADRVGTGTSKSVKDRLNENTSNDSHQRLTLSRKRQRKDDDKWEHDLYNDNEPMISKCKIGSQDLRLKLEKKGFLQTGKISSGQRDLREKLSGMAHPQPLSRNPPKLKQVVDVPIPDKKNAISEASLAVPKNVAKAAPRKTMQKKAEKSVDGFLKSMGLEKYSITFQAEEVDMAALVHMSDEDLKTLGIPMGPRKKICLAMESLGT